MLVDRAVDVDHHAACVGEDGEVARVRHGAGKRLDHRSGGAQQGLVGFGGEVRRAAGDGVEGDVLLWFEADFQAAPPRTLNPGCQEGLAERGVGFEHGLARLLDQRQALLLRNRWLGLWGHDRQGVGWAGAGLMMNPWSACH